VKTSEEAASDMSDNMSAATLIDTTIIGAGWSGLIAALRLAQADKKVLVLEARERIGGRAFTHTWNKETAATNARTAAPNAEGTVWATDLCVERRATTHLQC